MLDYGEPQILELFKNTLLSRLYYLLYQIENLNAVIETAKRILTKEKIHKQKTGQSSATPFMKASQDKSKKSEKGVSFGVLETKETIDRHSTSIDKLTSQVNKLNMKLDRQEAQYRPAVYQNRGRGCRQRQKIMDTGIGPTVKIEINPTIEVEETFTIREVIGPIIELGVGQEIMGMEVVIEEIAVHKIIEETIIDKTIVIKGIGIGIEVQVQTTVGLGRDIGAIPEIMSEIDHTTEVKVGIEIGLAVERKDKCPEQNLETETEKVGPLQDLDLVPMLIQTAIDLDPLDVVNMTILQENAIML